MNQSNGINSDTEHFSIIVVNIQIFLSVLSVIILFISGSYLWTVNGLSSFFSLCCLLESPDRISNYVIKIFNNKKLSILFILVNSMILFISSLYSFIKLLNIINYISITYMYTPILIVIILFLSSSIGLHSPVMIRLRK